MKRLTHYFKLLAIVLSFSLGCSGAFSIYAREQLSDPAVEVSKANLPEDEWTVLIYVCGTDLESEAGLASKNLNDLLQSDRSEKVNFLIQTGGTKVWELPDINPDVITRYHVVEDKLVKDEELPLANMGAGDTFGKFLKWGVKKYPAKKYMALVWNHGGGPLAGAASDELYDRSIMSVNEIADGLDTANVQFELVGFDACLMASMEVAAALSPYARYMVASEETEPGCGWNYTGFGESIAHRPQMNGEQLGQIICDSYIAGLEQAGQAQGATLSVTDLSKVEAIVDAFSEMVLHMGDLIEDPVYHCNLYLQASSTKHYFIDNLYDLVDFAKRVETIDSSVRQKVIDAVRDAVVYKNNHNSYGYSNGLSFFYEIGAENRIYDLYEEVCPSDEYIAYLDALSYRWRAEPSLYKKVKKMKEPDNLEYRVTLGLSEENEGIPGLVIESGEDAVTSIYYNIYYNDEKENRTYLVANIPNMTVDDENSIFYPFFDGKVISLNGKACYAQVVEEQAEYTLYETPIDYCGKTCRLRFIWYPNEQMDTESEEELQTEWTGAKSGLQDGVFEVLGIYDEASNSADDLASRDVISIGIGDKFTILTPEVDSNNKIVLYRKGKTVTYTAEPDFIRLTNVKNGAYSLFYVVTDSLGHVFNLKGADVSIKAGVMTVK